MTSLFKNIRFYVLVLSTLLAGLIFLIVELTIPEGSLQLIRLGQIYALTAVAYIYVALMASPLTKTFTFLPYRGEYIKSRRAIGVAGFFFALLHASIAFFYGLGGFAGLQFLAGKYLLAVSLGFISLVILALLTMTSFDYMIDKMGFSKWKFLQRFIYLGGVFILIHALILGSDFQDLSGMIPQIIFVAVGFLLILEANRIDKSLHTKFAKLPRFGLVVITVVILIVSYFFIK